MLHFTLTMETSNTEILTSTQSGTTTQTALKIAGTRFHFIGVGGVGMSGLAKVLIKNSAILTGSDNTPTTVTEKLSNLGADIKIGHTPENLQPHTDAVVISAAIDEQNPELKLARDRGCKVYKYAEMLGHLLNQYDPIAIAGTHGKSTTTGWLIYTLQNAGIDPNYIVGADIIQLNGSSGTAESPHFIVEACEYDRSFLNLNPKITCILNIEADHLDYYRDEQEIISAFADFANETRENGTIIANGNDPNVTKAIQALAPEFHCQTFGLDQNCDFYAQNLNLIDGTYTFDIYHNHHLLGPAKILLPGRHNVLNALAVTAMAANTGLDPHQILDGLAKFTGMDRRLMLKEKLANITILDDYAHHPTEIQASLEAIRQKYSPNRIWCIFQPHQYSRTRFLLDDFAKSFKLADITIVPEIYFVRDSASAKKAINAEILVDRIRGNGAQALFIDGFTGICEHLKQNVTAGDLVVTMGAGDIWKVADEYVHWLRQNC